MGRQQKDVNQDQAKWRLPSLLHHCVDSEYLQCKPTCRNDDNCLWTVPVLDAVICNRQANIITGWKESNSIWPNRSETVQPSSHPQPPPTPCSTCFAAVSFWHWQEQGSDIVSCLDIDVKCESDRSILLLTLSNKLWAAEHIVLTWMDVRYDASNGPMGQSSVWFCLEFLEHRMQMQHLSKDGVRGAGC